MKHSTYVDCRNLLVVSLDRVEQRGGAILASKFEELEEACRPSLAALLEHANEDAQRQRERLDAAIGRYAESTETPREDAIAEVADRARIARQQLHEMLSGTASWTRDELAKIAQVLGVSAGALLDEDEAPGPAG